MENMLYHLHSCYKLYQVYQVMKLDGSRTCCLERAHNDWNVVLVFGAHEALTLET